MSVWIGISFSNVGLGTMSQKALLILIAVALVAAVKSASISKTPRQELINYNKHYTFGARVEGEYDENYVNLSSINYINYWFGR